MHACPTREFSPLPSHPASVLEMARLGPDSPQTDTVVHS